MQRNGGSIRIGTAGWGLDSRYAESFLGTGSHLHRYGRSLNGAEINSSFHRPHRRSTYERWAESVPEDFRFSIKIPKAITHERRLVDCACLIDTFLAESAGLGKRLGCLLVQLPPSLAFDEPVVRSFFSALGKRTGVPLACEPRHASWFAEGVERALSELRVARVGADPARVTTAAEPGGWPGLVYYRLHGSPRMYYSDYGKEALTELAARLAKSARDGVPAWCIFDNTMSAAATGNALAVRDLLALSA
jgi:uncharacterized protein YecE (DUF72 family)